MAPRPYSERSSLPNDATVNESVTAIPIQTIVESPSPSTLSAATTPSPIPQEVIPIEHHVDTVDFQDVNRIPDAVENTPCYPTPGDIMPYDHSLPDFIRQITNQPNLANLQSLSLRVISTLISLHRMATYLPNLRELDLEGSVLNSLRDIGCNLKNLQILKVGRCQLESLDGTFGLSSLRELYASKNLINDVSPCSNLPHIRHIDVSGNRIRNISYAGFLSVCTKLKSIVFAGNPAAEVTDYRKHVRRILPQLESLDEIPFLNEDNAEDIKEQELIENICEGSDSSSNEVPDFTSVSPSDSMNNLFESEEDLFLVEKRNKHAKNIANQDQFEAADYEVQEVMCDLNTKYDFQDGFKNLTLYKKEVKTGLLEQAKVTENKNVNIKQKCTSIQKLDKDIENRSKKSNLMLNTQFSDEILSLPEINSEALYPSSVRNNLTFASGSSSTDISVRRNLEKNKQMRKETVRPSTASGVITKPHIEESITKEMKSGAIRKKPSTAAPKHTSIDEEDVKNSDWRASRLTSGLPICGNLTAALRNRKRVQKVWDDKECSKVGTVQITKNSKPRIEQENSYKEFQVQLNGSGDNFDSDWATENEEDLIGDDVLASSQKWREDFRRYRSNNRARWEEEDKTDYSVMLGESPELNSTFKDNNF